MTQYLALEAFLSKGSIVSIESAPIDVIKEVQSILRLSVDGLAGDKTIHAFAKFKADHDQGQPTMLGSGSIKLLLEHAESPRNPAVQRQIDRLTAYLPDGTPLNLDVKTNYFSQRDNIAMPHRTCNSSSNAMYCDWLLRVIGKSGLGTDDGYLRKILRNGIDTTVHEAHTVALKEYGFSTKWMTDGDEAFIKALLDTGFPVVCNILHRGSRSAPRGGHIIMLIGRENGILLAHDPYGTLASNYSEANGKHSQISESEFSDRWQGGYRILA